ncbi:hybrid non-ribosomal peptide synthetase/type I polyketide synthase [Haliangium ochraceum]|uniref:Amino acid adenylation domain protein n=1 Tax=Haliangium ochraceum (strain DSM 14365 / JCM 11303 / SMP-2) TaxID=502025 RepID=D0LN43_HALO1|nr:hybrid non-ribosomal peptide synthetase/type I polyketide synthase [Haliangium ochraceum]ACY13414.1 amino acid adenylation domain protein [Haliangium ochraceum DSM 14365]ALX87677.1 nonribosomal peptide synthase-polyketide synthase [Haliangium ochraceum DSM 14365]
MPHASPPRDVVLETSAAQRRIWTLEQRSSGGGYNVCFAISLPVGTSEQAVRDALRALMARHRSLRSTVRLVAGTLRMVPEEPEPSLDVVDLPEQALAEQYTRMATRRLDLAVDRPLQSVLIRHPDGLRLVVLDHHVRIDGTTLPILCRELCLLIRGDELPPLDLDYQDYVEAEAQWLASPEAQASRDWWRAHLEGLPASAYPGDRPRRGAPSGRGALVRVDLPSEESRSLVRLARERGCTPFRALVACTQALLLRSTGVEELPVGITTHGRWDKRWRPLAGMFTNPLLLRLPVSADDSLASLLGRCQGAMDEALAHARLPYDEVARVARDAWGISEPFAVMLGSQVAPHAMDLPEGFAVELHALDTGAPGSSRMDLKLSSAPLEDGSLRLEWELDTDILREQTVHSLGENLVRLVRAGLATPERPIGSLDLLSANERRSVRALATNDDTPRPLGAVLDQVSAWPAESLAISAGEERMSYGELVAHARRVGGALAARGVGPGEVVGLLLHRRPAAIATMLGVMAAGAAWLPIEPDLPAQRIAQMTAEADARFVIADEDLRHLLPDGVEALAPSLAAEPLSECRGAPSDPAYLLYTSGSTGRPKGVLVPRSALRHLLAYAGELFGMKPGVTVAALATWSFDIALAELLLPLVHGASVRLLDRSLALDPPALGAALQRVDVAQATPTTWALLVRRGWRPEAPLTLSSTGEALPPDLARALCRDGVRLLNLYGPTETTVWASGSVVDPERLDIGRPVPGLRCLVLDREGQVVPPGVMGELHIGGPSLALGYLKRPELTAERFIADPETPSERLYRSGDLARMSADGRIECLGRIDEQLKIRGHRIEPGEIEAALREHPAVSEAAVAPLRDPEGGDRLVAVYVCRGADPGERALRDSLAARLPKWMVPARMSAVALLPRTSSGKVDRNAIVSLFAQVSVQRAADAGLVSRIADTFARVLGVASVESERSFFEQGGTSMQLVVARERLTEMGLEVTVADLFDHPSPERLAAYLGGSRAAIREVREQIEPVAIVGLACRFPGGVTDSASFLSLLDQGRDAITEIPLSRWDADALYDPEPGRPGRLPTRWGGFLEDVEYFDPGAFGLSPREARAMDPQHRLLLELGQEAVLAAGYQPAEFAGREVGVYVGLCGTDYQGRAVQRPTLDAIDPHAATGSAHSVAAGRVAHIFDLRGPAVVVDTACSSSLVAVHLAVSALRAGECEAALVGGANVVLSPRWGAGFASLGFLSPSGRCSAFGAEADGYVRSEGAGMLLLKPLSAALADGDTVHAVIRGTAINHDGRAASLTAPSGLAQQSVIRSCLERAGLEPGDIDVVEAHGTGTELGDPIEVQALATALGEGREHPLLVGSVKSNLGHCEGAAGVAGMIKAVLAVREGRVFRTLHVDSLNPHVPWQQMPLEVAGEARAWPETGRPRRAGVSAFGFSGTNAHVILEQAPNQDASALRAALPATAYARRRLWLDEPIDGHGVIEHPMLRSRQTLADGREIFEGRVSLALFPELGDHRVRQDAVLPATWLMELGRAAGAEVLGSATITLSEIGLFAPVVIPERGTLRLQVLLEPLADAQLGWILASRREVGEDGWTRHAAGRLERGLVEIAEGPQVPADASDMDAVYARLGEFGVDYGPAFRALLGLALHEQGLVAALGASEPRPGTSDPVRMDAALQALAWHRISGPDARLVLPFGIERVTLGPGAPTLATVQTEGERADIDAFADDGRLVARIRGLTLRALEGTSPQGLSGLIWRTSERTLASRPLSGRWWVVGGPAALADAPGVEWVPAAAPFADLPAPDGVIRFQDPAQPSGEALTESLALVRALLELARPPRTLWLTRAGAGAEPTNETSAALWGLVRVLRQEHPELEPELIDGLERPQLEALETLDELALSTPERVMQDGQRLLPALTRVSSEPAAISGRWLITGASGGLGQALAQHLVARGAEELVLVSRTAPPAELLDTLPATFIVADVSEPGALEAVLLRAGALDGVVHAAGQLSDGVLLQLDAAAFATVSGPKLAAARQLAEALPLPTRLVLFSSVSAWLGAAGQAAYAAANAGLEAIAGARRARGGEAIAIAWGPWAEVGMAARASGRDRARSARMGLEPLATGRALALFDRALGVDAASVGAFSLNEETLRRALGAERVPAWLTQRAEDSATLVLPETGRAHAIREALKEQIAQVLALSADDELDWSRPFQDLGLDSLMAVELRDRLGRWCGQRLPATLLFDRPQLEELVAWLDETLPGGEAAAVEVNIAPIVHDEPIAIIGMGCRYPGGVVDPESFWELLEGQVDAVTPVPADRWDRDAWHDPDPASVGHTITREGGFVDGVFDFDPAFFGISPREARQMDPQQRVVMEVSWNALVDAGLRPEEMRGSNTGVYLGYMNHDYFLLHGTHTDEMDGHFLIGNSGAVVSGRVAYHFGFHGPALTLDTACSSALVAAHLGAKALRGGECDVALVGGVALVLQPNVAVEFSRLRAMSPENRCRSFAASANGVGWSEGCGMLVLKRLSDAERDGDRVLGVLRGSAVNQDGRSNGLTAPNGPAQEDVLRRALRDGGLASHEVDYVEAHGTGTALGDPIEANALGRVMGQGRSDGEVLYIGSVKSNLAHTQAAAGAAGVMKVLLGMERDTLPAQIHFDAPSPHIPWDALPLKVVDEPLPWSRGERARVAGVSSFGVSGTNAHVLIEEPPERVPTDHAALEPPLLLPLSAHSAAALARMAADIAALIRAGRVPLRDILFTTCRRRFRLNERLVALGGDAEALAEALEAFAKGQNHPGIVRGAVTHERPRPVFVFPGQGAQWAGMARELYAREPAFRDALKACDRAIRDEAEWSLIAWLHGEGEAERIDRIQPALFAVMVSLAGLWRDWGYEPAEVVGHSQGEVAAAYVAGALSLEDAVAIIVRRSAMLRTLSGRGAMMVVELTADKAAERIESVRDRVAVAVVNGPRSVVLSGDVEALETLGAELEAEGVYQRFVKVDVASHSPQMDPIRAKLLGALSEIAPQRGTTPIRSTVSTRTISGEEMDADYWWSNLRRPVRFGAVVEAMAQERDILFLEISAHPLLRPAVEEQAPGRAVSSLRREQPERETLLRAVAEMQVRGLEPDWGKLSPAGELARLPVYPWQRETLRVDWGSMDTPGSMQRAGTETGHPFLGQSFEPATGTGWRYWTSHLSTRSHPWLADHKVGDAVLLPGAAYVDIALALGEAPMSLRSLRFEEAMVLDEAGRTVQVALDRDNRFTISSRSAEGTWVHHARGQLADAPGGASEPGFDESAVAPAEVAALYQRLAAVGLHYGPVFQGIAGLLTGDGVAVSELELPQRVRGRRGWQIHPALLDAALQTLAAAVPAENQPKGPVVPIGVASVTLHRPVPERVRVYADWRLGEQPGTSAGDLWLVDLDGQPVAELRGLEAKEIGVGGDSDRTLEADSWLANVWVPAAEPDAPAHASRWLLVGDGDGLRDRLAESLRSHGHTLVAEGEPHDEIVWLEALDADRDGPEAARVACVTLMERVQRLVQESEHTPRLWLVTRGACEAQGCLVDPAHAAVFGFARSLAAEHAELRPGRIDLDPGLAPVAQAAELTRALLAGDDEDETALRGGARFVGRLQRRLPGQALGRRERVAGAFEIQDGQARALELGAIPAGALRVRFDALGVDGGAGAIIGLGDGVEGFELEQRVMLSEPGLGQVSHWTGPASAVAALPSGWSATRAVCWGLPLMASARQLARSGDDEPDRWLPLTLAALPRDLPEPELPVLGQQPSASAWRIDGASLTQRVPAHSGFSDNATWLISGGLGGLGLSLAEGLVSWGVRAVALLGRSGVRTQHQRQAIERMRAAGARVRVLEADVSQQASLEAALATLHDLPPLRGVVHVAGVIDDGMIAGQSAERLAAVFAPKVSGAWNLHRATAACELDHFVIYSSGASLLGSPGQSSYAAANGFVDGLAWARRSAGLPALSINWGAFSDVGLAAAEAHRGERLASKGLRNLTPEEGLRLVRSLLATDVVQVGALPFDIARWLESLPQLASSSRFAELVSSEDVDAGPAVEDLAALLASSVSARRVALCEDYVRRQLAQVIGIAEDQLPLRRPLTEMGLDSLTGLELRNRLEAGVGKKLSATLAWSYPTIEALAGHLLEQLASQPEAAAQPAPEPEPEQATAAPDLDALESELKDLDESDLAALLDDELDDLEGRI